MDQPNQKQLRTWMGIMEKYWNPKLTFPKTKLDNHICKIAKTEWNAYFYIFHYKINWGNQRQNGCQSLMFLVPGFYISDTVSSVILFLSSASASGIILLLPFYTTYTSSITLSSPILILLPNFPFSLKLPCAISSELIRTCLFKIKPSKDPEAKLLTAKP